MANHLRQELKELPLAGLMLRCSKNSSIARPIAEAAVVVQVPLNLAACGVDDVVKQHHAVCLEHLPWEAAAEDEICCHWSLAMMEAQVICTKKEHRHVFTGRQPRHNRLPLNKGSIWQLWSVQPSDYHHLEVIDICLVIWFDESGIRECE